MFIFLVIKRKKQIAYSLGALCSVLSVEDNFAMDCLCLRASLSTIFCVWVLIKWACFKASFPTFYPFGKITPPSSDLSLFHMASTWNYLATASIQMSLLLALAFDCRHGIFPERLFPNSCVSLAQDDGQGVSAAAAVADQCPAWWPPSPRLCHVPGVPALQSCGAEGLCSRLPRGAPAVPQRRRNPEDTQFAHRCLLSNGLGKKTQKTNVKTEGDSWDLISLVAVTIYPGKNLRTCGCA